jgi:hypothetical protein
MDTTVFTNILFASLSALIIIVIFGFAILLIFAVAILKSINNFLKVIKDESEKIAQDIESVREKVKGGGVAFASMAMQLISFFKNNQKKSKKK